MLRDRAAGKSYAWLTPIDRNFCADLELDYVGASE
jgi:hypothetical protein